MGQANWKYRQTCTRSFFPPYSPELNPVEHIWESARENWFGSEVFERRALMASKTSWSRPSSLSKTIQPGVAGMTAFPWFININLNAVWY